MVNPLISPAESSYITQGIAEDLRADGRSRLHFRDIVVETGVLPFASGSCRLKLGDTTDILVGVKVDVAPTDPAHPDKGRFECSVDCAPTATANLESAKSIDELTLDLTQMLAHRLTPEGLPMVDLGKLCIIEGQVCWVVYVDAMVLAAGGNMEDALFLAVKAALMTTRIPKHTVMQLDDEELDYEVDSDPSSMWLIPGVEDAPLCVTVNKIGQRHVLDASAQEEHVASARLHVFTSSQGSVLHVHKTGPGGIEPSLLRDMSQAGRKMAVQLHSRLAETLKREEQLASAQPSGIAKKLGFFA
ncbi:exosome complex exonuclease RRP42 [Catenaria anguillulae PL171]|uniref:Ribosomal RNA-processing protein 42 n=1 Tax=Catenaria anguillulae PL171 TaxID=765915 RepID=A0A1Y2H848_9FUNG|nr:exosome complex exonuclease RRP42 [Catenaria anguillulae PL171]